MPADRYALVDKNSLSDPDSVSSEDGSTDEDVPLEKMLSYTQDAVLNYDKPRARARNDKVDARVP